jgi:hypothetical protein
MRDEEIVGVEIDDEGRLLVTPAVRTFDFIFRSAMEVHWDPIRRCLFSPKPREWTYPMWFRQIVAAAADEYGVRLRLTEQTAWTNVPADLQSEMATELA